jgi:predicted RNA-binding Zn-ribbon protein involved in translation (DUF1610 family)
MNALKAVQLMVKYTDCPECGNSNVGDGEGKVVADEDTFYRSCRCGWEITTDENGFPINTHPDDKE